eukprot:9444071-Pyramimonas_sp.AAC.2
MGVSWSAHAEVPTHARHTREERLPFTRAVWSPVVHSDDSTGRVMVFYSESTSCWRPTQPPTWEPGGANPNYT